VSANRRLLVLILIPILIVALGVAGYVLIEGWTFAEALFMTVITLTTVGFGEVRPLSLSGRWFTTILILLGVGSVVYSLGVASEYLLTADVGRRLRSRRMQKTIEMMKEHIIVIGYGRVGRSAIDTLRDSASQLALVEKEVDAAREAVEAGLAVIQGDATDDPVLQAAGIERARTLIVCTGDTAANLFIVLSARVLNPDLRIIARSDAASEAKMRRAGADRIVSPYHTGGRYMANIALRPHVTDFLDVVTLEGGLELWLEELTINEGSPLAGQTVGQADIRQRTGVTLVALIRPEADQMITPAASTLMEAGDRMIVFGSRAQMADLERLTHQT
jgi:voltage-gated potassium channel